MTTIQYGELAKLYGQYATVVREAEASFKQGVNQILDQVLKEVRAAVKGVEVKEKVTGQGGVYRYWSLDSFDRPHVWFWAMDPRIVSPGELVLRVWTGSSSSKELDAKVRSLSELEEVGPLAESVGQSIFSVRYESKDGQSVKHLAAKIARLLVLLRDV